MENEEMCGRIGDILSRSRDEIVNLFQGTVADILSNARYAGISAQETARIATAFVDDLAAALRDGHDVESESYGRTEDSLDEAGRRSAIEGVSATVTAESFFALKDAMAGFVQRDFPGDNASDAILALHRVLDRLVLRTIDAHIRARDDTIREQQNALVGMSVPVAAIWDRILLVPLAGTLDSARTQLMMESLLGSIEATQSKVAIIDISGIPVVDSAVARHLIVTTSAARLMGAECIITGINARISQSMVSLGIDLSGIIISNTLAAGLQYAIERVQQGSEKAQAGTQGSVFLNGRKHVGDVALLKQGKNIVVPINVELHDKAARELQEDILEEIDRIGAKGLIIDVSSINVVDSFLGRLLMETAKMAKLMGADTVLVGLRTDVVISLVQLGMVVEELHTALSVEHGLALLEKLRTAG